MIIAFSRTLLTVKIGGNILNFGFRNVGTPVGPPVTFKFARKYYIMSPTQMFARFGFVPRGTTTPTVLKFSRHYYAFSPTQMFVRFGFQPRGTTVSPPSGTICTVYAFPPITLAISALGQIPCLPIVAPSVIDTHDGIRKRKKKKQKDFAEEIDRRKKIRREIEEVVHPTPEILPPLEPERVPEEVTIIEPLRTYRIAPNVDYAGLARDEIVAKLKRDALLKAKQYQEELHKIELKRLADEAEEEEELMMILDAIL